MCDCGQHLQLQLDQKHTSKPEHRCSLNQCSEGASSVCSGQHFTRGNSTHVLDQCFSILLSLHTTCYCTAIISNYVFIWRAGWEHLRSVSCSGWVVELLLCCKPHTRALPAGLNFLLPLKALSLVCLLDCVCCTYHPTPPGIPLVICVLPLFYLDHWITIQGQHWQTLYKER